MLWQKFILTAGSDSQNRVFYEQLSRIPTQNYSESIEVVTDESPGIRIGSGGATFNIIRKLLETETYEKLEKSKVLLLHSGGLSQRMPHLSAYGKAFGTLPNCKSILETKLEIYKNDLLEKLPSTGGIMITASDVIENMENAEKVKSNVDIIVFAHKSSLEVGTQHGVFVMDKKTRKLKRVLQKPTIEEMRKDGAIMEDEMVLTDSCYFMTWKFCKKFMENPLLRSPITEELCCYGDFMRPMGFDPKLDYIEASGSEQLKSYRKALADIFSTANVEISVLGENSFFHFGTYQEYIEHLLPNSIYRNSFPGAFKSNIVFSNGISKLPEQSFVEFSTGSLEVGKNSIVSGIDAGNSEIIIPSNTVVFTLALKTKTFVTIIIKIDEDIKKVCDRVKWNGHDTEISDKSIWDAPLFGTFETREKSLKTALFEWENGIKRKVRGKLRYY
ncbi:GDP-fucose pyrophosphorylase domain-containing protein [Caenorhabditis elegans]|uniref:Fucose pyrophosphorylase domain-containing protein n=1 Tax=Caenorhabditis elegans TaxID=6239 RepID=F5GU77_CAEEL|nr:L-fucokinase domain-containing protein [Caenorhabditis elegans]CCA65574.1 L-fucokinase domain-containing protein [Caenorhabditis elegans]|eukprot:NP_001255052.1 Uncharacterized protein CELE_K03H1.13 [Caenorhabditis elegans]